MESQAGPSRKRRAPAMVTLIACTECRRKRAKCDGKKPCGRCAARDGLTCVYDIHLRTTKETMKNEIDKLRAHRRVTDRILSALRSTEQPSAIIRQLKENVSLETISEGLENTFSEAEGDDGDDEEEEREAQEQTEGELDFGAGEQGAQDETAAAQDHEGAREQKSKADYSSSTHHEKSTRVFHDAKPNDSGGHSAGSPQAETKSGLPNVTDRSKVPSSSQTDTSGGGTATDDHMLPKMWTNVTSDSELIDHFLFLYFCWEYPTFASLSKEHFLIDFRAGRRRYCSSLLVNAILALGCRFSDRPETISWPGGTAGDQYFEECERLLLTDEEPTVPMVQALGLMALRESSCGRESACLHYSRRSIDLAREMRLEEDCATLFGDSISSMDREVRAATFWGCFNLEIAWSLCVGDVPVPQHYSNQRKRPAIVKEIETQEWAPYTDDGTPLERDCRQPSHIRSVYSTFCELSEIVHGTLYMLYRPEGRLTSQQVLAAYTKYLQWYSSLPDALRLGENFTPSVLFTHLYYHFAILLLFRPFLKLVFLGSAVRPREICTQAAESISSLTRAYRHLYTLRRTPSFVPYIVLASGIMHLMNSNTALGSAYCVKTLNDLADLSVCHGFAKRSLRILYTLSQKWQTPIAYGPWESEDPKINHMLNCQIPPSSEDYFVLDPKAALPTLEELTVYLSPDDAVFSVFVKQGLPSIASKNKVTLSSRGETGVEDKSEQLLVLCGFGIATISNSTRGDQGELMTHGRTKDDNDSMMMD